MRMQHIIMAAAGLGMAAGANVFAPEKDLPVLVASPDMRWTTYPMQAHAKTFKRNARSEAKRLRRRVSR